MFLDNTQNEAASAANSVWRSYWAVRNNAFWRSSSDGEPWLAGIGGIYRQIVPVQVCPCYSLATMGCWYQDVIGWSCPSSSKRGTAQRAHWKLEGCFRIHGIFVVYPSPCSGLLAIHMLSRWDKCTSMPRSWRVPFESIIIPPFPTACACSSIQNAVYNSYNTVLAPVQAVKKKTLTLSQMWHGG